MISMELQRDVPQYMAIPWLMTWVMARTVSVMREGEIAGGEGGRGPGAQPGDILQMRAGRQEQAEGAAKVSCKQCTSWLRSRAAGGHRDDRKQ